MAETLNTPSGVLTADHSRGFDNATKLFDYLKAISDDETFKILESALPEGSGGGGGATTLDGLTDVIIASPISGQVLKYNGTNWVNGTDETGGGGGSAVAANFGDGSATSFTITHNLGTEDIVFSIREAADDKEFVSAQVRTLNANQLSVYGFTTPPTTNQYRIIISSGGSGGGGGSTDLEGLTDVDLTSPTKNQSFRYNGSQWVNVGWSLSTTYRHITDYGAIGDDASHTITSVYGSVAAALTANPSWNAAHSVYTFVGTDQVDYAALQSAAHDILNWRTLDLGDRKLHINRKIVLDATAYRLSHRTIKGDGQGDPQWDQMFGAMVIQRTDNTPILETTATSRANADAIDSWNNDFELNGIHFTYLLQQESTMPNSIGFHIHSPQNTVAGMFYFSRLINITFSRTAYGIKTGGVTSTAPNYSASGFWNCTLEGVRFFGTAITCWDNTSTNTAGMPTNNIRQMGIFNTNNKLRDNVTPLVSTGAALVLHANENSFDGLDVEGWYNVILYCFGGSTIGIRGLHIEWHRFTGTVGRMFDISEGTYNIQDISISIDVTNVTDHISFFRCQGKTFVTVDKMVYSWRLAPTAGYKTFVDPQMDPGSVFEIGEMYKSAFSTADFDQFPSLIGWGFESNFKYIRFKGYDHGEVPVTAFGAVGNLTTSDNAAVLAALAFSAAGGKGIISFPPGNFRKTSPWALSKWQTLKGAGLNVTIIEDFGSDGLTFDGSVDNEQYCYVHNLTLRRDASVGTAAAGSGIKCTSSNLAVAHLNLNRVRITGYNVGIDFREGEQCLITDFLVDGCQTGIWIEGSGSNMAANFSRFERGVVTGCTYNVRLGSYTYKNHFEDVAFYGATTAAVYVPASQVACWGHEFVSCWWELNNTQNDLRSGAGFVFKRPMMADNDPFIVVANFGAVAVEIEDPFDLSNTGMVMPNLANVTVRHKNPNSETQFFAQHGTGHSAHRDGTHIVNLVAEGLAAGRSFTLPSFSVGAREANRLSTGVLTSWTVTGTVTGTIADPFGGTGAYRLSANGQALLNWASGAALTGRTITLQVWAKSNGGRLQMGMGDNVAVDSNKIITIPRNQWQLCHFTYTFPTATGTTLYVYVKGLDADVDVYWPQMSESAQITAALPYGRDLTAWTKPYEIKGPNHNVHTYGTAAPASGTWAAGDIVWNENPTAGGNVGWICTTGGTPGTWKTFGTIAA